MNENSPIAARYRLDPDWAWLTSPASVALDGAFTFVHRMSATDVFRAFDIDPGSARLMTAEQALGDPVLRTASFDEGPQWIRVAESGDWTVAVEYSQQKTHVDGVASHLARDAEVVFVAANEGEPAVINYLSHGEYVFALECGAPYDTRGGRRPRLFDEEMSEAGLFDFIPIMPIGDCVVAMMAILGRHLGFSLTPETVNGPLPTAYRMHQYTPPNPPLRVNPPAGAEAEQSPKPPPSSPA